MTVQAIRLQNFMGFQDTGWVELRSINLLFGRNSTGKSAILRALLLLRQSLDSRPEDGPLTFVAEDGQDFGGFRQMVYGQQLNKRISFWFDCEFLQTFYPEPRQSLPEKEERDESLTHTILRGDRAGDLLADLGVSILSQAADKPSKVRVRYGLHFRYSKSLKQVKLVEVELCDHDEKRIWQALAPRAANSPAWTFKTEYPRLLESDEQQYAPDEEVDRTFLRNSELFHRQGFLSLLRLVNDAIAPNDDEELTEDQLSAYSLPFRRSWRLLKELKIDIVKFLLTIHYLGPLRAEPLRYYYVAGQPGNRLDVQGRRVVQTYLAGQRNKANEDRLDQINRWLDDAGVGKRLVFKPVNQQKTLYEIKLVETPDAQSLQPNLREVGFGVSQVLPVLVQAMLAPAGSTVLIEQPELHLHPAAQAELGDLFISAAKQGVRFLIETHSEHLLYRLQRRIAETSLAALRRERQESEPIDPYLHLNSEDVSVYFISRTNFESKKTAIIFDKWGRYVEQPDAFQTFFSNDLDELLALDDAHLEAMEEETE